jgi:RES domain-containing protein
VTRARTRRVTWRPCYRLVPSLYPSKGLFDRVADTADIDNLIEVEAETNPRVRQQLGEMSLLPPEERLRGPGSTAIMAAFTHLNPNGSRFSDGTYGVYYAGRTLATAIQETKHHRERFLRDTNLASMHLHLRIYAALLNAVMHDIRGMRSALPKIYDHASYRESQPFGASLRKLGSYGIVYDSIRDPGGQCAAVFRPRALSRCREVGHLLYQWDGKRIAAVFQELERARG